jgi:hypothetical protein
MATAGSIKMPLETFEEVREGGEDAEKDLLFGWLQSREMKAALLLEEEVDPRFVQQVLAQGYASDLTDDQVDTIGRDPFLIAYALVAPADRCVVTTEVSSPRKIRQNRRIPDVCADVGVSCRHTFEMLKALRFSTRWRP